MKRPEFNAILVIFLMLSGGIATAQPVFVSGDQEGQGFLRKRDSECYLVTLQHVLGQAREARLTGDRAKRYKALLERKYEPDLAILRVPNLSDCPNRFPDGGALDHLLQSGNQARLISRNRSGILRQIAVEIIAFDELFIGVRAKQGEHIFRGMSGSLLMLGGSTAGILQSFDLQSGTGTILRQDYVGRYLESWFPKDQNVKRKIPIANSALHPIIPTNDSDGLIKPPTQMVLQKPKILPEHLTPIDPLPKKSKENNGENHE